MNKLYFEQRLQDGIEAAFEKVVGTKPETNFETISDNSNDPFLEFNLDEDAPCTEESKKSNGISRASHKIGKTSKKCKKNNTQAKTPKQIEESKIKQRESAQASRDKRKDILVQALQALLNFNSKFQNSNDSDIISFREKFQGILSNCDTPQLKKLINKTNKERGFTKRVPNKNKKKVSGALFGIMFLVLAILSLNFTQQTTQGKDLYENEPSSKIFSHIPKQMVQEIIPQPEYISNIYAETQKVFDSPNRYDASKNLGYVYLIVNKVQDLVLGLWDTPNKENSKSYTPAKKLYNNDFQMKKHCVCDYES